MMDAAQFFSITPSVSLHFQMHRFSVYVNEPHPLPGKWVLFYEVTLGGKFYIYLDTVSNCIALFWNLVFPLKNI